MTAAWLSGPALSFDCETSGTDTAVDRLVTAHAVEVSESGAVERGSWLMNFGGEIPAEASAIHGVTTERMQAEGLAPEVVIPGIVAVLAVAWANGLPVIVCNAPFDMTLLQAELARLGRPPMQLGPLLDPLVIDRALDRYRKGKRTLTAMAAHYGVKQSEAHSASGDALTAARVVWAQAKKYWPLEKKTLADMQVFQAQAHREWATQFEQYLREQGKPEVISADWPVRRAA